MNLLETITTGKAQMPPRLMIYGAEGVGKSSFAASAPKPIFVQTEDGLSEIDCAKFPLCTSFAEVVEQLKAIRDGEHEFQTLCVDSLDWLEREIVKLLNEIRARKQMAVILVAHAKVERFEDPEHPAYDRYQPRLHKSANSLVCEWADAVLFATRRMRVDSTTGKAAPVGADGGERILRTNGSPACNAKNRYSLPSEMALSWQAFMDGMKAGSKK